MDETTQAPEVVDLGDAKELTMGVLAPINEEDNPDFDAKK